MKKFKLMLSVALVAILGLSSCNLFDKDEETDPEKTLGKVGNYWRGYADGYSNAQINIT